MQGNPPASMQRITPHLYYEDVARALGWLTVAFGLTERLRRSNAQGRVDYGEMTFGEGVVTMGWPGPGYQTPARLPNATSRLYVYVDDVDEHFRRARAAGAKIITEPRDQSDGERRYAAEDCEGHHWYFATQVETTGDTGANE